MRQLTSIRSHTHSNSLTCLFVIRVLVVQVEYRYDTTLHTNPSIPYPYRTRARLPSSVCFDSRVFAAYCGAAVNRYGPDYLITSISSESLEWPRTLVEGGTVNGIVQQRVICGDAIDCQTKCERFARTSRNGLDIPENCALCDSICPVCARFDIYSFIHHVDSHPRVHERRPTWERPSWTAFKRFRSTWATPCG